MGGKLRDGFSIVGGVVTDDVKEFLDEMVRNGDFPSRSQAVGTIISEFVIRRRESIEINNQEA
jgi:hypothetical protein